MSDFEAGLGGILSAGVELWQDGERLAFRKAGARLTDREKEFLQANKTEILAYLGGRRATWLCSTQQRIWFVSSFAPQAHAYTIPFVFRAEGFEDLPRLRHCLEQLLARHAALRATFPTLGGTPVQLFGVTAPVDLPLIEVPEDAEARQQHLVKHLVQPFQLASGPLFRAMLFRSPAGTTWLGLSVHHLVADGWTLRRLADELAATYALGEVPAPAPPFTDFLHAERTLDPAVVEENLAYWRAKLANPPVLALPSDFDRPAQVTYEGEQLLAAFTPDASQKLAAFARAHRTTVFTVLISAFAALLHRYSKQRDLAIGTPYLNREDARSQEIIGCLMSTLVLRLEVDPRLSFKQLLTNAGQTHREALLHAAIPFERVVDSLGLERDTRRNPVFQVLFGQIPTSVVQHGQVRLTNVYLDPGKCQFELEFYYSADDSTGAITGLFAYNRKLFSRETAEVIRDAWLQLVSWVLDHPDDALDELPRLAAPVVRRMHEDWNGTKRDWPCKSSLQALLAPAFAENEDRIAIACGAQRMTYRQLRTTSDAVARALRAKGVGRGSNVGIKMQRSVMMVAALLGISKSGAAFVPLDPKHPIARLESMMGDAEVRVVVCDADFAAGLPAGVASVSPSADGPATAPLPLVDSADPAYVLFTSGSTGKPKGVRVSHGSLVNLLQAMAQRPGMTDADTMLAVTSLGFDISLLELLLPLAVGGSLIVATDDERSDPRALMQLLQERPVTVMQGTPSLWRMLVNAGWKRTPGLHVWCGGEALGQELASELHSRCEALWNLYGPTETTIWSTRRQLLPAAPRIDLGRPVENTRVYVLDEAGRPSPMGVPGELFIAGAGVALDYVNRPDLTAANFLTLDLPELGIAGERCYRTGDVVRLGPDGTLTFLGRSDEQVKLRGHRIELGEIEAQLRAIPGVADAAVVVQGEGEDQRLVGFFQAANTTLSPSQLNACLGASLPASMCPLLVELERMPLTPTGKIDRVALRRRPVDPRAEPLFEGFRSETEARLGAWFTEVLGTPVQDRSSQFFELGGHSLLATRLQHRIQSHFRIDLPLPVVFVSSTVAALSARVDELVAARREALKARIEGMSDEELARELAQLERLG